MAYAQIVFILLLQPRINGKGQQLIATILSDKRHYENKIVTSQRFKCSIKKQL
jgi:hypothetical protein